MANQLQHLSEFQEILSSYKISDTAKKELLAIKFVILTAPTSVGRNTIIKNLVKGGDYQFTVSDTTRHPRVDDGVEEQDGGVYWFKSEEEVLEGLKRGEYLEAAIIHGQQVSGLRVGEVKRAFNDNKIAITEVDIQGADTYTKIKPDTIAIFVLPPSFEEWMRRLKGRGQMSQEEIKRRLISAYNEYEYALKSNKFMYVVNDNLDRATKEIDALVKQLQVDFKNQEAYRELVSELSNQTKKYV